MSVLAAVDAPQRALGTDHVAAGIMSVARWRPGDRPEPIGSGEISSPWTPDDGVLCIVVSRDAEPATLFGALAPICAPDLTLAMVKDVLDTDALPKITPHAGGRARSVAIFDVETIRDPGEPAARQSGRLIFGSVELLAGPDWLIVCSQERETFPRSAEGKCLCEQRLIENAGGRTLFEHVAQRWSEGAFRTVGDLGVLLLHESTLSFRRADEALQDWVEAWEVTLFNDDNGDRRSLKDERDTLSRLRLVMAEYRRRLTAPNSAGEEAAEGWAANDAWFAGVTDASVARRAQRQIARSLTDLKELSGMLRSAFDLVQVQLSQRQQKTSEKLNRRLELIIAVILVPTLIAGIFGANTAIPGEGGAAAYGHLQWHGFAIMISVMVVGAPAVFVALRTMNRRSERHANAAGSIAGR